MTETNNRTNTSTQIRNLYSEGMSYLNLSFFNTNLSFKFYPFISRDNTGRSTYDLKNGIGTTVNFEGAFVLFQVASDIISGKIGSTDVDIACAAGANLNLKCEVNGDQKIVTFTITKNNVTIPHKFSVIPQKIIHPNGQVEMKYIQSGLGAFMKTVEGYLNGINADRHLNKLTDDYVKALGNEQSTQQTTTQSYQNNNQQYNNDNRGNNNYRNNYNGNGYKKSYNNNYKRQYNSNNNNSFQAPPQNNNWQPPQQQDLNSYQIKN